MKVSLRKQGSISYEIMELPKGGPCRVVDIADILAISYREAQKTSKISFR